LDPVILGALADRPIYYLARSDAFVKPWDYFLDAFNMMPIYRLRDGYSNLAKNEEVFERCAQVLNKGNGMLMFPEGSQDDVYYLRSLTKGIARIALQAQSRTRKDLKIIPVGLNYFNHFGSGRKLILNYGQPYSAKAYMAQFENDNNKAYRKFVLDLATEMKKVLVIEENTENYPIHKTIFTRKNEKLKYNQLKGFISQNASFEKDNIHGFLKPIIFLLTLPNFIPFLLLWYVNKNWLKKRVFHASTKLGIAVVILPIWFFICFIITGLSLSIESAFLILAIQMISLIIRSRLTRYIH